MGERPTRLCQAKCPVKQQIDVLTLFVWIKQIRYKVSISELYSVSAVTDFVTFGQTRLAVFPLFPLCMLRKASM